MKYLVSIMIMATLTCFAHKPHFLHISFHKGCINEIEYVAQQCGIQVTSWHILKSPEQAKRFSGGVYSYDLWNLTHQDAERIWNLHRDYFMQFDGIITSDTAPLARIFLQNNYPKPLLIWICCRFDYKAGFEPGCTFPDNEYYELFAKATQTDTVTIISYTPYEYEYARSKGIDIGTRVIRPSGLSAGTMNDTSDSFIPATVNKQETIFLAPRFYHQRHAEFVKKQCAAHQIPVYYGKYNGPDDLRGFKGVLHFPYQASTLALFENMHRGLVHFIPSPRFIKDILAKEGDVIPHFWQPGPLGQERAPEFEHAECYRNEYRDLFVYFDSWDDLKQKIDTTDYQQMRNRVLYYARWHGYTMIQRWKELFASL